MKWWYWVAKTLTVADWVFPKRVIRNVRFTPSAPFVRFDLCWERGRFVWCILDREEERLYMVRYYLWSTRFLERLARTHPICSGLHRWSRRVVLHRVHQGDRDGLHNHPWDWKTRILEGEYLEVLPDSDHPGDHTRTVTHRRVAGESYRVMKKSDYHRLELNPDYHGPIWTLFQMGPRKQDWGFLSRTGEHIPHQEYLENRDRYI